MGRYNKTIDGVFVDIVGTPDQISSYDKFLNLGKDVKKPSKELTKYTNEYRANTKKIGNEILKLAKVEEIIMQLRSKENIGEIKLSMVREYIYARCPFYRIGKSSKDIRVIVDKDEFWPNQTVEQLQNNKQFMVKAEEKLKKSMDIEINNNIREHKELSSIK
jgi:hypothetical protein